MAMALGFILMTADGRPFRDLRTKLHPPSIPSEEPVAENQREKRKHDHDHPNCMQAVPASSLFLPIQWKVSGIPIFHLVIDRYWPNQTENDDRDPEQRCAEK
jgi:hypothetical protein